MKWIILFMFLACGGQALLAQSEPATQVQVDESLTRSVQRAIEDIQTIRPGMTRGQLLKLFQQKAGYQGGIGGYLFIGDVISSRSESSLSNRRMRLP